MSNALITGAGSGIGLETARALARAGYGLTLVGRRLELVEAAATELTAAHEVEVLALSADVSDPDAPAGIVEAHLARFPSLDAVLCAAGIFIETPMKSVTSASWDLIHNVNLRGSALLAVAAGNHMAENNGGRIVLVASVSGLYSEKDVVDYNAAKAAVMSVAKSLAVDLSGRGVITNAIAPGWINTPQAAAHIARLTPEDLLRINPLGRPGDPAEVAELVRWLISDAPEFINGSTIVIDGGQIAQAPLV